MQCKVHIQSNQARSLESDFASFSVTRENQTTTPLGMNYHPTLPDEDVFTCVAGVSHTRDTLLEVIQELDMRQPHNNIMWNATFVSRNGTSIDTALISPI